MSASSTGLRSLIFRLAHTLLVAVMVLSTAGLMSSPVYAETGDTNVGGFAPLGDTFQSNTFTGNVSAHIPIVAPAGRMSPALSLVYSSQSVDLRDYNVQADWAGLGWSLSGISFISRDTRDTEDTDDDIFGLAGGGMQAIFTKPDEDGYYHTAIESNLRITRSGDTWTVRTPGGTVYEFGTTDESRFLTNIYGECHNWEDTGGEWWECTDYDYDEYVVKWYVTRITDVRGNYVTFSYDKVSDTTKCKIYGSYRDYTQAIYPREITYGYFSGSTRHHTITFNRSPREDTYTVDEDQCMKIFQQEKLDNIEVKADGVLQCKYVFSYDYTIPYMEKIHTGEYDDRRNPEITNHLTLRSVVEYGADGASASPPISFDYHSRLMKVDNGGGGSIEYEYAQPVLAGDRVIWPVTAKIAQDGYGQEYISKYAYFEPAYDSYRDSFIGFGHVLLGEPGQKTALYYHTNPDVAWKGQVYKSETLDGSTASLASSKPDFFDTFEGTSLDDSKWNSSGSGISVSDGKLEFRLDDKSSESVTSKLGATGVKKWDFDIPFATAIVRSHYGQYGRSEMKISFSNDPNFADNVVNFEWCSGEGCEGRDFSFEDDPPTGHSTFMWKDNVLSLYNSNGYFRQKGMSVEPAYIRFECKTSRNDSDVYLDIDNVFASTYYTYDWQSRPYFSDNFPGSELDATKWNSSASGWGEISVAAGLLELEASGVTYHGGGQGSGIASVISKGSVGTKEWTFKVLEANSKVRRSERYHTGHGYSSVRISFSNTPDFSANVATFEWKADSPGSFWKWNDNSPPTGQYHARWDSSHGVLMLYIDGEFHRDAKLLVEPAYIRFETQSELTTAKSSTSISVADVFAGPLTEEGDLYARGTSTWEKPPLFRDAFSDLDKWNTTGSVSTSADTRLKVRASCTDQHEEPQDKTAIAILSAPASGVKVWQFDVPYSNVSIRNCGYVYYPPSDPPEGWWYCSYCDACGASLDRQDDCSTARAELQISFSNDASFSSNVVTWEWKVAQNGCPITCKSDHVPEGHYDAIWKDNKLYLYINGALYGVKNMPVEPSYIQFKGHSYLSWGKSGPHARAYIDVDNLVARNQYANELRLFQSDGYLYDGDDTCKHTQSRREYDTYGNVTKASSIGEVDVTGDELYAYTEYINDEADWILGVPKHSFVKQSDDATIVAESWNYYSDTYDGAMDHGSSHKYLRKTETATVFGSRDHPDNPTIELTYDQWGNVVSTKDALGNTMVTTEYDSVYHMFPVASTNAHGRTSYTYYYGVNGDEDTEFTGFGLFGQVKSIQDVNGKFVRSKYDEFGRVVASWPENFSEAYPAMSYEYEFWSDADHPNKIVTHAREQAGEAASFDTFVYVDGLGRVVQEQTPSEDAAKMMVSGPVEYNDRGLVWKKYVGYEASAQDTIGVFRSSNRTFYLDYDNDAYTDEYVAYGLSSDIPTAGDWNGDGKDTIGVFRPSNDTFYLDYDNDGVTDQGITWGGMGGGSPIIGDWNGDGKDTIGLCRPGRGNWFNLDYDNDGIPDHSIDYGNSDDLPLSGDWNGDGKDTIGVFRPSNSIFYLDYDNDGHTDREIAYGASGDKPITGDWNGDGKDTIGVVRGGVFKLDYDNDGVKDFEIGYGLSSDTPIAGNWNRDPGAYISNPRKEKPTTFTYDPVGRLIRTDHLDGASTRAFFDDLETTVIDANDKQVRETVDVYGRVVKKELFTEDSASFEGWFSNYPYRRPITVTASSSELTDYQVVVLVDTAALISAGKMRSDCADIQFTASDGSTEIPYRLENNCNTNSTNIWVEVPSIPTFGTSVYMYYGNTTTGHSNESIGGNIVFSDQFEPSSDKWTGSGYEYDTTHNGYVHTYKAGAGETVSTLTSDIIGSGGFQVQLKMKSEGYREHSNCSHKHQLIVANGGGGEVILDSSAYAGFTEKTYLISGNDLRLKLYAYAKGGENVTTKCSDWTYSTSCGGGNTCSGNNCPGKSAPSCPSGYSPIGSIFCKDKKFWDNYYDCWIWECKECRQCKNSALSAEAKLWIDDVSVRKYASPEPGTSVGQEEGKSSTGPGVYSTTSYDYDPLGRLVMTTDDVGNQATYTYDNLGRKTAMHDPDMGDWSYVYDKLGRLTSQIDAKGQEMVFTYDILNRLIQKTYPDGSFVQYDFDTFDGYTGENSIGRLVRTLKSPGGGAIAMGKPHRLAWAGVGAGGRGLKESNAAPLSVAGLSLATLAVVALVWVRRGNGWLQPRRLLRQAVLALVSLSMVVASLPLAGVNVGGNRVLAAEDWLSGWDYRKPITIGGSSSTLGDYQVLVTADTASLISAAKMRSDCGDLRFTASDGTTEIPYWLESGCNTTATRTWVKAPSIPTGGTTIYVYYGNSSASSVSNGVATFEFFDDFASDTTGQYSEYTGAYNHNYVRPDTNNANRRIRWKSKLESINSRNWAGHWKGGASNQADNSSTPGDAVAIAMYYNTDTGATSTQPSIHLVTKSGGSGSSSSRTRATTEGNEYIYELRVQGGVRVDGQIWDAGYSSQWTAALTSNVPGSLQYQFIQHYDYDGGCEEEELAWLGGDKRLRSYVEGSHYGGCRNYHIDNRLDWWLVSKYASPEPSTSIGDEEQGDVPPPPPPLPESESAITSVFYYDDLGRQVKAEKTIDGVTYTTETAYDDMGRATVATYPEGSQVHYTYNPHNGIVAKVGSTPSGGEYLSSLEHNEQGQLVAKTFGNGVTVNYTYNPDNFRLTNMQAVNGADTIQNLAYFYDNVGMLTGIVDHQNEYNWSYEYDDLYRLTRARRGSGTTLGTFDVHDKSYAYDTIGNITSFEGNTYAYDDPSHVHAVTSDGANSYTYDANGNMLSGAGRSFTWNYSNKPTTIVKDGTTVDFSYGPGGERVKKAWGSNHKIYVGGIYEKDQDGSEVVYITAGGARIKKEGENVTFFLSDHQGGTNVITDGSGDEVTRQYYQPYGKDDTVGSIEGEVDAHKFTDQEQDVETGLYYYNARYYDPALGRFVSADPVQGLNRYAYCGNNPVNAIDPSGFSFTFVHITDLHVAGDKVFAGHADKRAKYFAEVQAAINALASKPVLAIVSGDISHHGAAGIVVSEGDYDVLTNPETGKLHYKDKNGDGVKDPGEYHLDSGKQIPMYFVRGNHDYRWYIQTKSEPESGKFFREHIGPTDDYTHKQGNAEFFILDSGWDKGISIPPDGSGLTGAQIAWLEEGLEGSSATCKIIVMHHPPEFLRKNEAELKRLCETYKVDLIVVGHTHQNALYNPWDGVATQVVETGSTMHVSSDGVYTPGYYRLITVNDDGSVTVGDYVRVKEDGGGGGDGTVRTLNGVVQDPDWRPPAHFQQIW